MDDVVVPLKPQSPIVSVVGVIFSVMLNMADVSFLSSFTISLCGITLQPNMAWPTFNALLRSLANQGLHAQICLHIFCHGCRFWLYSFFFKNDDVDLVLFAVTFSLFFFHRTVIQAFRTSKVCILLLLRIRLTRSNNDPHHSVLVAFSGLRKNCLFTLY